MMGRLRALALGLAIVSTLLGTCPARAADSLDDNKDVVLRFYDLFNAGDASGLSAVVDNGVVHHDLPPGLPPGFDGFTQQFTGLHAAFPDIEATVVDTIAEGNRVAVRVFITGTQKGTFYGIPPSGNPVAFEMMDIYRLAGGKIAEVWEVGDLLTLMVEIGAIPSPGAPPHVLPSTAPKGTADLVANKAVAQRYYDFFSTGNLDTLSQVVDANVVDHEPGPDQASGIQGLKQSLTSFRASFANLHLTLVDVIAEGDKVVVRSSATGTHAGTFLGVSASGLPVTIDAVDINRIANGKIVETWHVEDVVSVLAQIGAGPIANAVTPPAAPVSSSSAPPAPASSASSPAAVSAATSTAPPVSSVSSPAPFSPDPGASAPILATYPRFTGPGYAAGHLSP